MRLLEPTFLEPISVLANRVSAREIWILKISDWRPAAQSAYLLPDGRGTSAAETDERAAKWRKHRAFSEPPGKWPSETELAGRNAEIRNWKWRNQHRCLASACQSDHLDPAPGPANTFRSPDCIAFCSLLISQLQAGDALPVIVPIISAVLAPALEPLIRRLATTMEIVLVCMQKIV
jgi:hypothetical protein